jgi:hypothetical protein
VTPKGSAPGVTLVLTPGSGKTLLAMLLMETKSIPKLEPALKGPLSELLARKSPAQDTLEGHVLRGLARLLPAAARTRFTAEARGNLGDCDQWWQRVDQLVCLALGTPRLAWMMWREGRRGRVLPCPLTMPSPPVPS